MKTLFRRTAYITITALMILSGCDDYLSVTPDNRVDLNTADKAAQLLTNAYSNGSYTFTEWMGDNVRFTVGTQKLPEHNQCYNWEDVTSFNQDTPTNFWTSTYDAIAHANEVLAVIDNLEGDRKRKEAVKGEAYLTRAYGHFMLVNLFAKHYDPQTSDDDPGIPYVLEPETEFIKKYERNTVKEVYNFIEDDIEDGLKYVDDSYYANSGKYHFTKNAALAFASRFYLFKGDLDKCIEYSSEMLGDTPESFVRDIPALLSEAANPIEFVSLQASADVRANLLLVRQVTNFPVNVGYWADNDLIDEVFQNPWDDDDTRRDIRYPLFVRGGRGLAFGKYDFLFERSSLTSNVGLYYTIQPVLKGEEVLLNRAEAYARDNQLTQALADLQVFVNLRYVSKPTVTQAALKAFYGSNNNQTNVIDFIVHERRKEFFQEGLRWFDIKKYKIPVQHYLTENGPDIQNPPIITLDADDDRKIIQIPQTAIDVGGLEPNPRD